jgi:hypothetical protein
LFKVAKAIGRYQSAAQLCADLRQLKQDSILQAASRAVYVQALLAPEASRCHRSC